MQRGHFPLDWQFVEDTDTTLAVVIAVDVCVFFLAVVFVTVLTFAVLWRRRSKRIDHQRSDFVIGRRTVSFVQLTKRSGAYGEPEGPRFPV